MSWFHGITAAVAFCGLVLPSRAGPAGFMRGADLSMLQHVEDHGVEFMETGQVKDPLMIFKDHGCNYVRLRLFLNPNGLEGQVNTLPYTLRLAKRVRQAGLKFLLDLHYSDAWADPGHQAIPAGWRDLPHDQLVPQVFAYTRRTLESFQQEGCMPDMVEVGNEITNGMMWPDAGPLTSDAKWDNLADVLKAGIRGLRECDPKGEVKVMIHIDKGGSKETSRLFFDKLQRLGVRFDVIGLSYYPFWHGSLADLRENLDSLAKTYQKDIIVVETAYEKSGGPQKDLPFPLTPDGQKAFLEELTRVVAATPDGRGAGICYWAPEWIAGKQWNGPGWSAQCESRALFDSSGNMLPGVEAFRNPLK